MLVPWIGHFRVVLPYNVLRKPGRAFLISPECYRHVEIESEDGDDRRILHVASLALFRGRLLRDLVEVPLRLDGFSLSHRQNQFGEARSDRVDGLVAVESHGHRSIKCSCHRVSSCRTIWFSTRTCNWPPSISDSWRETSVCTKSMHSYS